MELVQSSNEDLTLVLATPDLHLAARDSVRGTTDTHGRVTSAQTYDAWGTPTRNLGPDVTPSSSQISSLAMRQTERLPNSSASTASARTRARD